MSVRETLGKLSKVGVINDAGREGLERLYSANNLDFVSIDDEEGEVLEMFLEQQGVSRDNWHLKDGILWLKVKREEV